MPPLQSTTSRTALPLMHITLASALPLRPHHLRDSLLYIALAVCLSVEDTDALKTLGGLLKRHNFKYLVSE
ncbi:hypothetical protein EV1_040366 [Malus domestica]